jgi:hypothetical protein
MTPDQYQVIVKNAFNLPYYTDKVQDWIRFEMESHEDRICRNYLRGENGHMMRDRSPAAVQMQKRQSDSRMKINTWLLNNPPNFIFTSEKINELGVPRSTIRDQFVRLFRNDIITEYGGRSQSGYKKYIMNEEQHKMLKELCGIDY